MTEVIKSVSHKLAHRLGIRDTKLTVEGVSIFLLWLFTISSLIGIGLGYTEWFISKTPINLLLGFLLVILNVPFTRKYSKAIFVFFFIFGMVLEIAGVIRGDIFGTYYYGENLGFKVFGVPLMIGIYWAVLTTVTSQISRLFFKNIFTIALTGASLMVGLDFFMEQMAHVFDFWHFTGNIAPFQNYVTWFIAAFVLHLLAVKCIPKGGARFSTHLYLNQVAFFIVTFAILKLW
ncbi:MAG: carotenoid biosynthesis protein [Saprospiraceae bacterium]|nr:carotenoid biosynthesis protein [Saprospiraceae bacterium]